MANVKEPLVLFLIGMRINSFWRVWEWLPAFLAMGPMIVELYKNPELGFLRARTEMAGRTTYVVRPGEVESLYADMPADFGLGGAVGRVPVGSHTDSARQRKGS